MLSYFNTFFCIHIQACFCQQLRRSFCYLLPMIVIVVGEICNYPLSWRRCSERLAKIAENVLEKESLEVVLPILRATVKALPNSLKMAESISNLARIALRSADAGWGLKPGVNRIGVIRHSGWFCEII